MTGYDFRVWSASLPIDVIDDQIVASTEVRPWNGRPLTKREIEEALKAARADGPQAAFEWLSENAW